LTSARKGGACPAVRRSRVCSANYEQANDEQANDELVMPSDAKPYIFRMCRSQAKGLKSRIGLQALLTY